MPFVETVKLNAPLIIFEGCDGTGKTTTLQSLSKSINIYPTQEPFNQPYIDLIKQTTNPYELSLLFAADRLKHLQHLQSVIKPIICDRYFYSNLVYQSIQLSNYSFYESITYIGTLQPYIQLPQLVFYFTSDTTTIHNRVNSRGEILSINEINTIKETYEKLLKASKVPVITIDTSTLTKPQVINKIILSLKEHNII